MIIGFGGERTLDAFLVDGGGNPFAPSNIGVSVGTVAVVALVCGVGLQVLSTHVHVRTVHLTEE